MFDKHFEKKDNILEKECSREYFFCLLSTETFLSLIYFLEVNCSFNTAKASIIY